MRLRQEKKIHYEADTPQSSFNLDFCHQIFPSRSLDHCNLLRWHHPVSFCVKTPASVSSPTPYSSPRLASEPADTSNHYTNMVYHFPQTQNFNKNFCSEKLLIWRRLSIIKLPFYLHGDLLRMGKIIFVILKQHHADCYLFHLWSPKSSLRSLP